MKKIVWNFVDRTSEWAFDIVDGFDFQEDRCGIRTQDNVWWYYDWPTIMSASTKNELIKFMYHEPIRSDGEVAIYNALCNHIESLVEIKAW